MINKFTISSDDESFSGEFETRQAAINECLALYEEGKIFHVGEKFNHKASEFFCVEELVESMAENARGEYLGLDIEWLDYLGDEAIELLNNMVSEVIDKWASENGCEPIFYGVDNSIGYRKVNNCAEEIKS